MGGIGAYPMYGVPVSVTLVQSEPTDNFQLIVVNMAVLGVDQPVPIVVGKVENGQYLFRSFGWIDHMKLTDDPIRTYKPDSSERVMTIEDWKKYFGKPVVMHLVVHFIPDKYDYSQDYSDEQQKTFLN